MYFTDLHSSGENAIVTIPKTMLDSLGISTDSKVGLEIEAGRLVLSPPAKIRYTLSDLVAQCDASADISKEDADWLNAPTVGKEEI